MSKPIELMRRVLARLDPRQSSLFGIEHEKEIAVSAGSPTPDTEQMSEESWLINTESPTSPDSI